MNPPDDPPNDEDISAFRKMHTDGIRFDPNNFVIRAAPSYNSGQIQALSTLIRVMQKDMEEEEKYKRRIRISSRPTSRTWTISRIEYLTVPGINRRGAWEYYFNDSGDFVRAKIYILRQSEDTYSVDIEFNIRGDESAEVDLIDIIVY